MPDDPVAFFLTWPTYGTWLPGDHRGWVLHQHGWKMPDPAKQAEASVITRSVSKVARNLLQ